jgi:hypothetical protein
LSIIPVRPTLRYACTTLSLHYGDAALFAGDVVVIDHKRGGVNVTESELWVIIKFFGDKVFSEETAKQRCGDHFTQSLRKAATGEYKKSDTQSSFWIKSNGVSFGVNPIL